MKEICVVNMNIIQGGWSSWFLYIPGLDQYGRRKVTEPRFRSIDNPIGLFHTLSVLQQHEFIGKKECDIGTTEPIFEYEKIHWSF